MPRRPILPALLLCCLLPAACCPPRERVPGAWAPMPAEVLRVIDGDTWVTWYDGEAVSVRLAGVDAPERRDPDGPAATELLRRLLIDSWIESGREGPPVVTLRWTEPTKRDAFGRLLATVVLEDGRVVNEIVAEAFPPPPDAEPRK